MYQAFYQGSDYIGYPLLALGIFFTFFTGMVVRAYWPRNTDPYQGHAELPLAEESHGNG